MATELVGLAVGLVLFSWLHNLVGRDVAAATGNALVLQSVERALGLDIELSANQWLAEHPAWGGLAVIYYRLYYLPLVGVLLWVLFRQAEIYVRVRRTLIAMATLALLVFWLVPMSPPRFALAGIVDIVAEKDLFGSTASRDLSNGVNHFSAMPSLHVAWSAWCAFAAWSAWRVTHPRAALLAWLFPLLMIIVVITTGNHYVLDVAGSIALLAASIAIATMWERLLRRRRDAPARR